MKKLLIVSGLLILISIYAFAQNMKESYEEKWKKVESFQEEGLPKSASAIVSEIMNQAIKEGNNPQALKAMIYNAYFTKQIDNQNDYSLIFSLEDFLQQTVDTPTKAMTHSMLAELYSSYQQTYFWKMRNKEYIEITDKNFKNTEDWSPKFLSKKIEEHIASSIADKKLLTDYETNKFADIIVKGKDSKVVCPTMYDFLMQRAIEQSYNLIDDDIEKNTGLPLAQLGAPAKDFVKLEIPKTSENLAFTLFQEYMSYLLTEKQISNLILTEVDKNELLTSQSFRFRNEFQLDVLDTLIKEYEGNSTCVEFIALRLKKKLYPISSKTRDGDNQRYGELHKEAQDAINKYHTYKNIAILQNFVEQITRPFISLQGDDYYYSKDSIILDIEYKNIQSADEKGQLYIYKNSGQKDDFVMIRQIQSQPKPRLPYYTDTLKLNIGTLPVGEYRLTYIADNWDAEKVKKRVNNTSETVDFIVTDLAVFSRSKKENAADIFVVNRKTGEPIEGATVRLKQEIRKENKKSQFVKTDFVTNKQGLAHISLDSSKEYYRYGTDIQVILGADSCLKELGQYNTFASHSYQDDSKRTKVSIFTDRNLYRPGQTTHYKAIALDSTNRVVRGKELTVILYDTNYQVIKEEKKITNEFGSISGSIILPKNGLLGYHSLKIEDTNAHIYVEEYKRPTFEVTFEKVEKTYSFDEEIEAKGTVKNFSGIPLQDIKVEVNVKQFDFSFFRGGLIDSNFIPDVKTNEKGEFTFKFTPKKSDSNNSLLRNQINSFVISAVANDVNGERQEGNYSLVVADVSMIIDIKTPYNGQIEKGNVDLNITAQNLQYQDIETSGKYTLYLLDENNEPEKTVLTGTFKTGKQAELANKMKSLASGKYQLHISALDSNGKEVESSKDLVLFSYKDKKPAIKTDQWFVEKNKIFDDKTPAELIFGTSYKNEYVLYETANNTQVFERQFIKLSEINKTFKIPYKKEYGKAVIASFTFVRDGQLVQKSAKLTLREEVSSISLKLDVFRDKLRPGQKEKWTLSVKDNKDQPVLAEILASMYDRSLDKIRESEAWNLDKIVTNYLMPYQLQYNLLSFSKNHYSKRIYLKETRKTEIYTFEKDALNWFDYSIYRNEQAINKSRAIKNYKKILYDTLSQPSFTGSIKNTLRPELEEVVVAEENDQIELGAGWGQEGIIGNLSQQAQTPIRLNFAETAFFYPHLVTNERGKTMISFTVPDSNTSWNLRILAHDKDGRDNLAKETVITRKEMMITPNMPRFVRQGDETNISTKISNLSDDAISGKVRIEFFNPITDEIINIGLSNTNRDFNLEKDASSSADWTFTVPNDIELLGCRIVAESEIFSDGEQHALAVLPNRKLVTESTPFQIDGNGTANILVDKLVNNSPTATNYRLTMEYTSTPAWYAVMALSTMKNTSEDNTFGWLAQYYTQSLATSIMVQYPKVSRMIKAWKEHGGDKKILLSNLDQNEELKNILLEETPWVLEAKDENEQMERLSLLFDVNTSEEQVRTAISKLRDLQNYDGGWTWHKGMYSNENMTQYVLSTLTHLVHVGQLEHPQEVKEMQMQAIKYIDGKLLEGFNSFKNKNKDWATTQHLSINQFQYLYTRSFYRDIPIDIETRNAERFYTKVASENWTKLSLYEKAILSIVVRRNGDKTLADKIVKSIKEFSITDNKLGMYWPNNRGNARISMLTVSQFTYLMEALIDGGASQQEINQMNKWLILQKKTQKWESTITTINAISMLLGTNTDWFDGEKVTTQIQVGNQTIDTKNSQLGTGYIKQSYMGKEISKEMAKIQVKTENQSPSYGAVYFQYFEDLDKIAGHSSDLQLNKTLYKESIINGEQTLVEITEDTPIQIGDMITVRLTVRTNQDLEFVHLKDMRAACFEPTDSRSGTHWTNRSLYYQTVKDVSTNYYFDYLAKGTYTFDYKVYANRTGKYSNGVSEIQSLYSPDLVANTAGKTIYVTK